MRPGSWAIFQAFARSGVMRRCSFRPSDHEALALAMNLLAKPGIRARFRHKSARARTQLHNSDRMVR